jgi:hypothetical protein
VQSKAPSLSDLVSFLNEYAAANPGCPKAEIAAAAAGRFGLSRRRSVYFCGDFAIRFSIASGSSFSNTIVALSTLRRYDDIPFVVCILRPKGIELLLANTTFLKKISHTSQKLESDNVRGSFNGTDILRAYGETANIPENFEELFSTHQEFTWEENLLRLVETTYGIAPTGMRFEPSKQQRDIILDSAEIAILLSRHPEYKALGSRLRTIVETNRAAILTVAADQINNVNLRGNMIEQIVTQGANFHKAEDLCFELRVGPRVMVDVKTKIVALASSPKAYNIDKVLRLLSVGNTVFSFFFIGLNLKQQALSTRLVSILDQTILKATRIQFHWAGRNSRGHTQLSGDLMSIFEPGFQETIDVADAKAFLRRLIELNDASSSSAAPASTQD